jgi:hypothetical protein
VYTCASVGEVYEKISAFRRRPGNPIRALFVAQERNKIGMPFDGDGMPLSRGD